MMDNVGISMLAACGNESTQLVTNALFWAVRVYGVILSMSSIWLNVMVGIATLSAIPLSLSSRRLLAATCLAIVVQSCYIFARSIHSFIMLAVDLCHIRVSFSICKLLDFTLVYCYVVIALMTLLIACAPAGERPGRASDRIAIGCGQVCTVWLSVVILLCGVYAWIILLIDYYGHWAAVDAANTMEACTVLLAMRTWLPQSLLLGSIVIIHIVAICVANARRACIDRRYNDKKVDIDTAVSADDAIALLVNIISCWWLLTIAVAGVGVIIGEFDHRNQTSHIAYFVIEMAFYCSPQTLATVYPVLIIVTVRPIRHNLLRTTMRQRRRRVVEENCDAKVAVPKRFDGESVVDRWRRMSVEATLAIEKAGDADDAMSWRTSNDSQYLDIDIPLPDDVAIATATVINPAESIRRTKSVDVANIALGVNAATTSSRKMTLP